MFNPVIRRSHPAKRVIFDLEALTDRIAPGGAPGGVAESHRGPLVHYSMVGEKILSMAPDPEQAEAADFIGGSDRLV